MHLLYIGIITENRTAVKGFPLQESKFLIFYGFTNEITKKEKNLVDFSRKNISNGNRRNGNF